MIYNRLELWDLNAQSSAPWILVVRGGRIGHRWHFALISLPQAPAAESSRRSGAGPVVCALGRVALHNFDLVRLVAPSWLEGATKRATKRFGSDRQVTLSV